MYGGRDGLDGYHVNLTEALSDVKMWRVYRYGYPYSTPEQLGVETEEDAYLATKQAGYWVLRGRTLEELDGYFRAGQTVIAGQKLEDIQRRGQKVVNAIYNLVYKAYNSTETPANSNIITISKSGGFVLDTNKNYYSQTYTVTSVTDMHSYSVTKFSGFPSGSYTADLNGNAKATFSAGEKFKVMIPKSSITGNINGEITLKNKCKTYPVYFGKSSVSGYQDFAVTVDPYGDIHKSTTLNINAFKSGINIIKTDEETGIALSGVTYNAKYSNGTNIGNYTTDKNGKITLNNLRQGRVVLTEISTKSEYILDTTPINVDLEYEQIKTIELTNKHKKGNLKIIKVDKDDNSLTLGAVEFDLIDSSGKIIKHLKTDVNGICEVKGINTGNYTLRETLTKKEYNLAVDQDVVVNWNETMEIKVENEKKKGQIKIIKVDADYNEVKLEGVEFQIIDKNNHVIETIKTNSEGVAVTSRIPIGDYKIKESSLGTNEEYILNDEIKTIVVEEDKIKTIQFENEHKKGNLKIYKVDLDDNTIPVPDVEFEITDQDGYKYTAISDEKGIAYIQDIRTGIATIKELKTNKIYKLSDETYNAEINWDKTTEITITNEKLKGQIEVYKIDAEDKEIKLEGVEFQVINSNNEVVETIVTNSDGYAITSRIPIGEYRFKGDKNR